METPAETTPLFSGDHRLPLDPKNRITVPAKFRGGNRSDREPEELFILKSPTEPCLLAYRQKEFLEVGRRMEQSDKSPGQKKLFKRMFFSSAKLTLVDRQGRMVIHEDFRKILDISSEVHVVGADDHFEVWRPELWEELRQSESTDFSELAASVGL
jgi:division/cell wall cluster transcriptional repressor MraZ